MPWRKPVAVVSAAVRGALVLLAAVAAVFPTVGRAQPTAVQQFFDEFTADWVRNDPNLAVSNRYFAASAGASADAALQTRLERDLTPQTEAYRREKVERARRGLARLGTLDRNAMTDKERLSADVLAWQLTSIVDGAPFGDLKYPLEQFRGANVTLVDTLTISHPIASKTDGDNYLARLALVPVRLREAIAEAKRLDAKNIRPPRFILAATIAGMRTFIGVPPEQSPFVTALAQKLATVNGLAAGDRDALVAQAALVVRRDVTPAWNEAIALLESQVARSTDDAGLWRFADGAAAYAWQLNANTTTKLTADQIHAIGLEQVARIKGEMEAILTQLGRTEGTLEARIAQLQKDQAYPLTDAGRTQIMADIDVIMKDAQARSKTLFELTPKAAVIAQAFPKYQEATAAGSYNSPSPDGTRPGTFRIPLRPNRMTKFGLKTLVYHETVPGHHYQIALSREDTSQPRFRQLGLIGGLPAISEGWGLYAERLAVDSGWYEGDPIGHLGQLDAELFRARRLVVDTGLHAKHWTRQQAIDFGIEASEIDRYVVMPGQANAYMIGQLELIRQREKARQALGAQFSLRDFHTAVQRTGIVPLELLNSEIDRFIAMKTATSR